MNYILCLYTSVTISLTLIIVAEKSRSRWVFIEHTQPLKSINTETSKKRQPTLILGDTSDAPIYLIYIMYGKGSWFAHVSYGQREPRLIQKQFFFQILFYREWSTKVSTTAQQSCRPLLEYQQQVFTVLETQLRQSMLFVSWTTHVSTAKAVLTKVILWLRTHIFIERK